MPRQNISLWSGPRNVSTALMYAFANRQDCTIFDEPLYAYYLKNSNRKELHPGYDEIMQSMSAEFQNVIDLITKDHNRPFNFSKNMAHHIQNTELSFLKNFKNVILTRDPKEVILSFRKQINSPIIEDLGYDVQWKILDYCGIHDIPVIVFDSKRILLDPKGQLKKMCDFCEIPYTVNMLNWPAGPIPEDGVWAKYWYKSVHSSTGFNSYKAKTEELPLDLIPLYKSCMSFYEQLQPNAS